MNYPRLAQLALYYLTIPLTCYASGRLKSAEGFRTDANYMMGYQLFDGLGLPRIIDPLGRDRSRLNEADQPMYNVLWHNTDLIFPVMTEIKETTSD